MISDIQKKINKRLKEGHSKQDIYDELKMNDKNKKKLAKLIQSTVSPNKKRKYGIKNTALIVCLIISSILEFYTRKFDSFIIFNIILLVVALAFYVRYYLWIIIKGALNVILYGSVIFNFDQLSVNNILVYSSILIISIVSLVIALHLMKKLNPKLEYKQADVIKDGKKITRTQYDFLE